MSLNFKVASFIIGGVIMNPNLHARGVGEIQQGLQVALAKAPAISIKKPDSKQQTSPKAPESTAPATPAEPGLMPLTPIKTPADTSSRIAPALPADFDEVAASTKGVQIFGTIVNTNPKDNVVLIKTLANNQTTAKKVNSSLQLDDTYLITIISQVYIELMVPGKRKIRLYKEGFVPQVTVKKVVEKKGPAAITGSFKEDGFERNGASMVMTEEYRKKMLEKDLPNIMMQAAAEPEVDANGNVLGFRLEEIENGSMYAKAGMQDGDVITAINGEDLSSAQGAIKTLNSLRSANAIEFEVMRGGTKIPVKLEVK